MSDPKIRLCHPMDQTGNVILFRIPSNLKLEETTSTSRRIDLTNLRHDVLLIILDTLDLTDRVCLGLTCKSLALKVTCAPGVPAIRKVQATYPLAYHVVNDLYQPNQTRPLYISFTPEWYTLLPRLAKGWVPKEKFKYCWKCNKIYSRDRSFYEGALSKQKLPGWLWKLNLTEQQWTRMDLRERHEHMITRWLTHSTTIHESMRTPATACNVYYPDLGICVPCKLDERGPECPLCLERELTHTWKGPEAFAQISFSGRVFITGLARLPIDLSIAAASTVIKALRSPC